jgi:two-component system, cell cycle sensor histidine kinase and response regulator CckA
MNRKRILVVDDEPSIRLLLRDAISGPELEIILAEDAERALLAAEEPGPLELVVTDIYMPGMDGLELATHLAARGKAAKFLFLSGYYDRVEFGRKLNAFPCAAFLEKPFAIPELLRVFRRLLTESTAPSGGIDQFRSFA